VASGAEVQAESIGQRLRRLRLERGLSQRDLSSPGVSYAYISRIEAGARRPSVKALRKLAAKLGVSADYLETGSEIRDTEERELAIADAELGLRLGEARDAEERLERLHEEALAAGDAVAAGRATVALGLAAAAEGRNTDAIERLEAALEEGDVAPSARPDLHTALGGAYAAEGRPDLAVDLLERCLDQVARETPDDVAALARVAAALGRALSSVGETERARTVLEAALDSVDGTADPYARVRLYRSLAREADARARQATALDYMRRAVALLEVSDDSDHLDEAHRLAQELSSAAVPTGAAR
jgi:transcriptional regulator with XRE-family HTH domain